jgi:protein-disulfide isomerase-like protein with CxxC motif
MVLVGGMWLSPQAPAGGADLYGFIAQHTPRLEQTTGVTISQSYFDLVQDSNYVFSSMEPCAAFVWAKSQRPEQSVLIASAIQTLLFHKGKRLDVPETYQSLMEALELSYHDFTSDWLSAENVGKTQTEFQEARKWAQGFPTLVLQEDETARVIASGYFKPENLIPGLSEKLNL